MDDNEDKKEEKIIEAEAVDDSSKAPETKDEKPEQEEVKNSEDKKPEEDKKKNMYDEYRYWGTNPNNNRGGFKGGKRNRLAFIAMLILLFSFFAIFFSNNNTKSIESSYSDFISYVDDNKVKTVNIVGSSTVKYTLSDGVERNTKIPYSDPKLMEKLLASDAIVKGSVEATPIWYLVIQLLPWLVFCIIMYFMLRSSGAFGGGKMMGGLGKSLAKEYSKKDNKVTFADVAGQKEAKYELQEVVDFLKNPKKFAEIGAKIPKGVLLVGPPGTGKTLLARAVAGEAGVTFLHTSGSDFVEMFVGMGAARVRDLFDQARKSAPCIIFIDELDAVGRARGSGLGGGHDEREQTLNQMLVEMDGFSPEPGVIVIAATNRPDVLDPALLRPGRFDRQVTVALPDVQERLDILRIHTKRVHITSDVELDRIARATPGTSGADLANLVNEAALFAARKDRKEVTMDDFEEARDKILLGVARASVFMTEEEKRATAYHEAGHTILHYYLKHVDPLHKVTIIPHGRALGLTMSLPEKENYTLTRSYLEDRIKVCMGGYVAEDVVYGETTTGTSNDIKQATDLARRMVTEFGMSSLGFISLANDDEPLFLGREIAQHKDYSEETAKTIDSEIHKILDECMNDTRNIITTHRDQLDALTEALVAKETLSDAEIRDLFGLPAAKHVTDLK